MANPDRSTDPGEDPPTRPGSPGSGPAETEVRVPPPEATRMEEPSTRRADETAGASEPGGGDGVEEWPGGVRVRYIGDYELQGVLGRGGMGVVYRARQVSLNRPVALKMIRDGELAGPDDLRRFRNEAEAVAALDHPRIVPIYEVGEHDGRNYFSMKLVDGLSLEARLGDLGPDPAAAARLVAAAAEAVDHAHRRGILHRDLKPANILIDRDGTPHVTDFGLARRIEDGPGLTASGAILGTPSYMAPEQSYGVRAAVTTASDVYGLGAVLYALLTGRAPFGGDSVYDTLRMVREAPPEPPRRLNPRVPRDLEIIALKCLEKEPRRRYASAQALADDLGRWLRGEPIEARPVGVAVRLAMWCRRRPAIAGLSAALAVVAAAGLVFGTSQYRAALDNAEAASRNESAARGRSAELAVVNRSLVASRDELRRNLYVADMTVANIDRENRQFGRMSDLLDRQVPRARVGRPPGLRVALPAPPGPRRAALVPGGGGGAGLDRLQPGRKARRHRLGVGADRAARRRVGPGHRVVAGAPVPGLGPGVQPRWRMARLVPPARLRRLRPGGCRDDLGEPGRVARPHARRAARRLFGVRDRPRLPPRRPAPGDLRQPVANLGCGDRPAGSGLARD
ncbi:Serine/threonine-protein kinase PrkC [Aquisphaera giovannonii]|uniref:non-specific serine/threonine protein kinase n=1 Tax=Aquisphaera giovannonii TaxID=406548 RepID=A0A5B9W330_9BACT|nr:serine/threonine-protein kinase [Aquisphaera giovannonii]QEH34644.1 Serine/threonine-protein kinase PrkC [Aquisphaera giovannonii]